MKFVDICRDFPSQDDCIILIEELRWNKQPKCPYCGSNQSSPIKKAGRYHCNNCNTSYSVIVNTIFHNTKLPLQKWFYAIGIYFDNVNKITISQFAHDLRVNKNTAWYIRQRIQQAMTNSEQRQLVNSILQNLVER